jgi:hypothetical protein
VRILERLPNRSPAGEADAPASAEASSADERRLPSARYDQRTRKPPHSPLDHVDAARDRRYERERLRDEARYRRERLELYRARLYSGRATSHGRLRELQRASDGAAARLRRAEAAAPRTRPST